MPAAPRPPGAAAAQEPHARRARILVMDDRADAREQCLIALGTVREYEVSAVESSREALEKAREWRPDVIILDITMRQGELDGIALGRRLRAEGCDAELMFLTGAKDLDSIEDGLEIAEQYLTKPWQPRELLARVRALLRRRNSSSHLPTARPGWPEIDYTTRVVRPGNGCEGALTSVELKVLLALLAGNGKPVSYADIITNVWGVYSGDKGILNVNISRIRQKLEVNPTQPELIVTVPRVGYLYVARS